MQEKGDRELFVKQLKDMLDWYTFQAADEEYDEDNVEHILNLLDSFDPIGEEDLPQRDAAWERFRRMAGEELPVRAAQASDLSASDKAAVGEDFPVRAAQAPESAASRRFLVRMGRFTAAHRYIAAAVLALLILTVSGSAHAIATQGSDFFFWLKRDETGTEMMVSPEGLNGVMEPKEAYHYQSKDDLPEWAQEWTQIADCVKMPEGYEFQYFEVSEFGYYQSVVGHYMNHTMNVEILLGAWAYFGKVSYNSETFEGYSYVQSYEVDQKQLDIFDRTDEKGDVFYVICFYEENCRYLVKGQDDLEELKLLAERYLHCVQENL